MQIFFYFTTNFLGKQIEVTSSVVQGIAVTLTFIFAVIFGIAIGFFMYWDNSQKSKLGDLDNELRRLDTQIQQLSKVEVKAGEKHVEVTKAPGTKCERCWKYSEEVGNHAEHSTICPRCIDAITK